MKKRICAVIMCLLLAVNLVGVPKAKAVVPEGALLASLFGSLLVSMGYSWAADNFDAPSFGEAIYDLIKECDGEMDTGIQLLLDSHLAGLTAVGNGKLTFSQQWVKLANSFAEWFQSKYFVSDSSQAVIYPGGTSTITTVDGVTLTLTTVSDLVINGTSSSGTVSTYGSDVLAAFDIDVSALGTSYTYCRLTDSVSLAFYNTGTVYAKYCVGNDLSANNIASANADALINGRFQFVLFEYPEGKLSIGLARPSDDALFFFSYGQIASYVLSLTDVGLVQSPSLSAEKPQEVHYPDVAEDGSQVYEITVDGVTATDIEGIVQGAVDRILAGTAAIAGEVAQAQDVPVEPEVPAAGEYAVPGLESIFPFCIPFDIYAFCSALNAEPVAPSFEWRMQYALLGLDYTFEIDLSAFDGVAQVLRTMELLVFCVGLAFWTRHLIRG